MLTVSSQFAPIGGRVHDLVVTLACWIYFTFGFIFFFSYLYVAAFLLAPDRESAFQRLNHLFFKGLLGVLRLLSPRQSWDIDAQIGKVTSSIIVCNHLSYLDPLILISLLPRQKTIVKTRFFQMPIFGWVLKGSGYLPATSGGGHGARMIEQMETMEDFLGKGGNLFVFPEGTRSRNGKMGPLHKGVFKIGRMYRCPIYVLGLSNTDKLFTPGKFLFNASRKNRVRMSILRCIDPQPEPAPISVMELEKKVRETLGAHHMSCHRGRKDIVDSERSA